MEVKIHAFLNSTPDGELSASYSVCFTLGGAGTHWTGGRVDPKYGLDMVAKKKSLPCRKPNPGRPDAFDKSTSCLSLFCRMAEHRVGDQAGTICHR